MRPIWVDGTIQRVHIEARCILLLDVAHPLDITDCHDILGEGMPDGRSTRHGLLAVANQAQNVWYALRTKCGVPAAPRAKRLQSGLSWGRRWIRMLMLIEITSGDVDRGPVDARPAGSRDPPLGFRTHLVAHTARECICALRFGCMGYSLNTKTPFIIIIIFISCRYYH